MHAAVNRPSAIVLLLVSGILAHCSDLPAQTLPEPAEDEGGYDSATLPPAEPPAPSVQAIPSARPRLGVTLDPRYGVIAVVRSVVPDSPADHAGLKPGDTIEALNGNRVESYDDVLEFIEAMRPGDVMDIDFSRRITGRTQAILDRDRSDELPEAAGDAVDREPVDQAAYEPLPAPAASENRGPQSLPRRDFVPRPLNDAAERAADRDDARRRGRSVETDDDRDNRRRLLLRWRRR
jgi:membrane-associated protease RseP (regulator of RpoE activity)